MGETDFDASARNYASMVTAVRRLSGGAATAPATTTLRETADWLMRSAAATIDFMAMMESLIWRIRASGLPLHRVSAHVGTLHPQVAGVGWLWEAQDGFIDEIVVKRASRDTSAFSRNPLARVLNHGETVRVRTEDPAEAARFPLTEDLAARGITDYLARPVGAGAGGLVYNAMTMATTQPGGFSEREFAELTDIFDLFALHIQRHIATMVAENVMKTYLGESAGRKVLDGAVMRGEGERTRAVIWVSDLRGFTDRSDRMAAEDVSALMSVYFEALAGAVMAAGGEVLKFIGDGLLAVFPVGDDGGRAAAEAALVAVADAGDRIGALNAAPPPQSPAAAFPLESGVALHLGDVFFGNVGSPNRLDFTVIGAAVNVASRVEALTKTLGRDVLLTAPVADLVEAALDDLGRHALRGLAEPIGVFGLRAAP